MQYDLSPYLRIYENFKISSIFFNIYTKFSLIQKLIFSDDPYILENLKII
jgi:hypothetical protein